MVGMVTIYVNDRGRGPTEMRTWRTSSVIIRGRFEDARGGMQPGTSRSKK